MNVCLGLDTSNYRTSTALCAIDAGAKDSLYYEEKRLLCVEKGQRGLMQSQALFQHVCQLPVLLEKLMAAHADCSIVAVCASVRPRPVEGSYMPVFRAGEAAARSVAAALKAPCFFTTHQQGHLRAARIGTPLREDDTYLALHLSGGTTEMLLVGPGQYELVGGSGDLHAGQLIDRIGVAMGLSFPAGPALEALACHGEARQLLTAPVKTTACHFSGAETKALSLLAQGEISREDLAAEVFSCVARAVSRLTLVGCERTGAAKVLLGGGVASSALLHEQIRERVARRNGRIRLYFARPELSGDNAVGVAVIGAEEYKRKEAQNDGTDT